VVKATKQVTATSKICFKLVEEQVASSAQEIVTTVLIELKLEREEEKERLNALWLST